MKIYRPDGKLWREVVALDSSFCEETLERFNRISLDFVLAEEVLVPELCYVTWRGERYSLFSTPKVVKVSTREYRYTLNLEGRHLELDRVLVKDKLGRTKFVFTGRADQYAELISDCLPSWKVGACTTGDTTRVIAFNNTSLLEACRMVASKFETEVQLTDGAISFGRVERYKSDPLLLAYRNGLKKDITVEPDPKETAIGRLYVVGGDRNIDPVKYGGHQLHLPKDGKVSVGGRSFVADAEGRYISLEGDTRLNTSERAFDASSIYPKRVGTVSKVEQVGDEWDVLDDANTIDYGQHRVGGDTMRLEFQSGRLAGRTFDLATKEDKLVGYVHSEKRFKLVRKEIDGVLMPEPTTFYPAVGDKYAIFGCSLPDEYITSAEGEMLLRGAEYMAERLEPRLQYRAELDGLWAKKNWNTVAHKLVVGTIVRLEGASSEVRISSVRTSLNSPYTPRITFSNAPYMVGSLATQIATLENAEVRQREELRAGLVKLQDRTYKDTEAVREMVEQLKVEGFSKALKPKTLQTMYAVIGSPALQFEFVGGGFSWTEGKGGAVTIPQQVIRQRVAGTTLEPEPKMVETTIPALTYTLKPDEQQAHIYVELKPTPRYVISTKPLQITTDRLLVGLLNGEEGSRDFTPLYGFTEISPSHIATRYIRSRSGNMLIDLETGNIYSDKIEFRRPDGSTKGVEQVIKDTTQKAYDDAIAKAKELDGQIQVGGRNLAVMSRMVPGYLYGDHKRGNPGDVDYKVLQYGAFHYDPTYYPIEEGVSLVWVIKRKVVGEENPVVIIHWHNEQKELIRWDFGWWTHPEGTPRKLIAPKGTRYYRVGITHNPKDVQVMLERGTVATDWTPAPEDVQAEIDAINANPPRINQTTKNWEVYVPSEGKYVDTGRTSVGDDGKAPKIVNGYWYEWNASSGQYTNTGIKAQGVDGKSATQVRDNLWTSSQYSLSLNDNYGCYLTSLPDRKFKIEKKEPSKVSWFSAASYYTYPIKNKPGRYTISFKVIECSRPIRFYYDTGIDKKKGDLVGDLYYHAYVSSDGRLPGFAFTWGEADTDDQAKIGDYAIIEDIKIERVEEGEDPRPTAYLPHPDDLKGKDVDPKLLNEIQTGLTNANTLISTLDKAQKQLEKGVLTKADIKDIQYLLDSLKKGKTQVAGGLVLTNDIILSDPNSKDVTAMISGTQTEGAKAIRLGIAKDGTETTVLNNDGTGHVGNLYFEGNRLDVREGGETLLKIGVNAIDEQVQHLDTKGRVSRSYDVAKTTIKERGEVVLTTFSTDRDGADVSLHGKLMVTYPALSRRLPVDYDFSGWEKGGGGYTLHIGYTLSIRYAGQRMCVPFAMLVVRAMASKRDGGYDVRNLKLIHQDPLNERPLHDTYVDFDEWGDIKALPHKGKYELVLGMSHREIGAKSWMGATASFVGAPTPKVVVTTKPDRNKSSISTRGARFYGDENSYFDVDYTRQSNVTAQIKGGLKVDTITADSYQGNGMPLAGATFDSSGSEVRALGRYKNKSNSSFASAYYDYSTKSFTVYHSIPHSRYIPLVNAFNDPASPVVSDVSAYSFKVRFTLQSERYNGWAVGFSYIAFQAE